MREWFNRLSRVARAARGVVEPLEPRRLLCYGPDLPVALPSIVRESAVPSAALSDAPLNPSGLPLLHSLPGARAAVFLDFDGFATQYTPFDADGVSASFSPSERADIENTWRHVASYFSMFDLDVTTEPPAPGTPFSYSIISNGVLTGSYNLGSFPSTQPTNFSPPGDARHRQTALAHEIGHSFDLEHQATFDPRGNLVAEYSLGYDALHGALMGVDLARDVHKWFVGHPSNSAAALQDDVALIAGRVAVFTGGDGFRPDDAPDTPAQAVELTADASGRSAVSGIIERLTDADAYAFESAGGSFRIEVTPPAPSMLDAKVELYASDGSLVAAADAPASNAQHLSLPWLEAGTYHAVVSSHGDYADLGPYDVSIQMTDLASPESPPDWPHAPPPPRLLPAEGTTVAISWDAATGALGYALERSDDGAMWDHVAAVGAAVTTFHDTPPLGGHRYFYRVSALHPMGPPATSGTSHVINRPAPPTELSVTSWESGLVLNWRDTSGETGYRIFRRFEPAAAVPGPWVLLVETGPNVPSLTDPSLPPNARVRYRVEPVGRNGPGASAEVVGGTPFEGVTGIRAAAASVAGAPAVRLEWDGIDFPVGYSVERSSDGNLFTRIATVAIPTYMDTAVDPASRYYYRVVGTNDLGFSASSAPASGVTTGAPLPAGWQYADVGPAGAGAAGTDAAGAVAYDAADGLFRVVGGGGGLLAPPGANREVDSFRYLYRGLTGDGSINARIIPDADAVAGIMIRDGTEPSARYVFAGVTPDLGRGTTGRGVASAGAWRRFGDGGTLTLRIVRTGDVFIVYERLSSNWFQREVFSMPMAASVSVGLVCCSGSDATLATARFDGVAVNAGHPPLMLTEASAAPETVTGTSASLWVGADPRGEASLTYHWSVEDRPGSAPMPLLSRNDGADADYTTATFFAPGRYTFRATVTNAANLSSSSTVVVEVLRAATRLVVVPAGVPVFAGDSAQFVAAVFDQFCATIGATGPAVVWSATHGHIDPTGEYTAPPWAGWDQVTVVAGTVRQTLDVFVYDAAAPALLSAVSRKVHRRGGAVDLPLALYGGPAVVEPRRGGPTTVVFTFSGNVSVADGLLDANDFNLTNATFRSASLAGRVLTLELEGVRDGGIVYVGADGLAGPDGAALIGDTDVEIRPLYGDATRDGVVNAADVTALRTQVARRTGPSDLLYDLDLDGIISAGDQAAARRRIVSTVPTAPQPAPAPRAAPARRSAY